MFLAYDYRYRKNTDREYERLIEQIKAKHEQNLKSETENQKKNKKRN